jgi:hypothetical protein
MRMSGLAALVAMTAIVAVSAACGGGGSSSKTPAAVATGASTPASSFTPFATPQITGNQVVSDKGYSATFPQGWHARANFINTADSTVDAFFEPLDATAASPVQASIIVMCGLIVAPADEFIAGQATLTAQLPQNQGLQTSPITVSGVPGRAINYRNQSAQNPDQPALDKQDVFFTAGKCNWTITTTTRAGERAKYQPLFDAFISSFKLK